MDNNIFEMQKNAKYRSARMSLLLIVILSVVNIFSVMLSGTYYLFTSYFTLNLVAIGYEVYVNTGVLALYIIFAGVALISVLPYFLCWLFSKKKIDWMIAALVLFSVDSVLFLVDFILTVAAGEMGMIFDLIIRAYALWCLAYAVKCGVALKKATPADSNTVPAAADEEAPAAPALDEMSGVTRKITVTRKKSFTACALLFFCHLDGVKVGELKNGATVEFPADGRAHELGIISSNGMIANAVTVTAGDANKTYLISIKAGMMANKIIIEEMDNL